METKILENTIIKIGGLLVVGFGEAGGAIIAENLSGGDSSVKTNIAGSKVEAVFGYVNIRQFTLATETLMDKIMLFVNQIGEIVHGIVNEFHGCPNKNTGSGFLVLWRCTLAQGPTFMANMAVLCALKMQASIAKSPLLFEYRKHPGLLQYSKEYRVNVGIGLHFGWAIEGLLGSEFKIEASYLSPHVNYLMQLEQGTKLYGLHILVSDIFAEQCTAAVSRRFRVIDRVIFHGSVNPTEILSMDIDPSALRVVVPNPEVAKQHLKANFLTKYRVRQQRDLRKAAKLSPTYDAVMILTRDVDIVEMRSGFTQAFFEEYDMSYRNYIYGDWDVAKDMLRKLLNYRQENPDGPSIELLAYMDSHEGGAPPGWPAYRRLDRLE